MRSIYFISDVLRGRFTGFALVAFVFFSFGLCAFAPAVPLGFAWLRQGLGAKRQMPLTSQANPEGSAGDLRNSQNKKKKQKQSEQRYEESDPEALQI